MILGGELDREFDVLVWYCIEVQKGKVKLCTCEVGYLVSCVWLLEH